MMSLIQLEKISRLGIIRTGKFWPYLIAAAIAFVVKLPTLNNIPAYFDEMTYLAQARLLDSPEAFIYSFQYRTETKFQLGLVPYILAQAISQPNAIIIVRLLGLAATVAIACLLVVISKSLFDSIGPGFFAIATWFLYLHRDISSTIPLLEYYQTALLLFSFWLYLKALQNWSSTKIIYTFWSSFSLALATLVKPPALLVFPVLALILIFYKNGAEQRWLTGFRLKQVLVLTVGFSLPIFVFLFPYFFNPAAFDELKFSMLGLTSSYATNFGYNGSLILRMLWLLTYFEATDFLLIFIASIAFFIGLCRLRRPRWTKINIYQLILIAIGDALYLGFSVAQLKSHYLIPVLPFLMLFVGYQLRLIYLRLQDRKLKVGLVLALGVLLIASELNSVQFYLSLLNDPGQCYRLSEQPDAMKVASYIKANSKPEELIWVYYNAPEIYWLADRKPATNVPDAAWLVGLYNDFWFDRTYRELVRDKPKLIIGFDTTHYNITRVGQVTELPRIKELLAENYNCSRFLVSYTTICKLIN
jgi:4-amino-4-deoxy-L-arabinose transferase-like glycosyltransferase